MVAVLVRDDVGVDEQPALRPELLLELVEEAEIDVDRLVGGAVEGSGAAGRGPAARLHRAGEEDGVGRHVAVAEGRRPEVLDGLDVGDDRALDRIVGVLARLAALIERGVVGGLALAEPREAAERRAGPAASADHLEDDDDQQPDETEPAATDREPAAAPILPPPPRRSDTPDVSSRPLSRYLMSGRPPGRVRHRESDLDRTVHLLAGRREVEGDVALEPSHRSHRPRDLESATGQPRVAPRPARSALRRRRPRTAGPGGGVASSRARSYAGLSVRSRRVGPNTSTSSSRPRATTRLAGEVQRFTVTRVCTEATGSPGARRSRTSTCTETPAVRVLDRVVRGRQHRGDLGLPGGAALQRGLPVAGAGAHGDPDVGDLRIDQQDCLATDQHVRRGGLGTARGDLPRFGRTLPDATARWRGEGTHRERGRPTVGLNR